MTNQLAIETHKLATLVCAFTEAAHHYVASVTEVHDPLDHKNKAEEIIFGFKQTVVEVVQHSPVHSQEAARAREEFKYYVGFLEGMADSTDRKTIFLGIKFDEKLGELIEGLKTSSLTGALSSKRLGRELKINKHRLSTSIWGMNVSLPLIAIEPNTTSQFAKLITDWIQATQDYVTFGTQDKDAKHREYNQLHQDDIHKCCVDQTHYQDRLNKEIDCFKRSISELVKSTDQKETAKAKEAVSRRFGYIMGMAYANVPNPHHGTFQQALMPLLAAINNQEFLQSLSYPSLKEALALPEEPMCTPRCTNTAPLTSAPLMTANGQR